MQPITRKNRKKRFEKRLKQRQEREYTLTVGKIALEGLRKKAK